MDSVKTLRRRLRRLLQLREFNPRNPHLLVPGMVSRLERENLVRQASCLEGRGHAVEFGAFVGASTASILKGLSMSGFQHRFHVYDLFRTNDPWFSSLVRKLLVETRDLLLVDGEYLDFSRVYEHYIQDDRVETHRMNVTDLEWIGEPIEFIHLDLPKDWYSAEKIVSETFPFIVPRGILIFQDFVNQWSFELIALIGSLLRGGQIRIEGVCGPTLSTSILTQISWSRVSEIANEMSDPQLAISNFDTAVAGARAKLNRESLVIMKIARALLIKEFDHAKGFVELANCFESLAGSRGGGSRAFQQVIEFGFRSKRSID